MLSALLASGGTLTMKFYATIKSERASKGQGGKHLEIEITDEDRDTILFFTIGEKGVFSLAGRPFYVKSILEQCKKLLSEGYVIKGKKQKTEKDDECEHESTILTHDGIECADCHLELDS